jgi:thiol:disulfide interchange protein DsbD
MPHLPKPGAWMEKLKEFMGFLLLATVLWLVWVLGQQVGTTGMISTLCFLLSVSFSCWLIGRCVDLNTPAARKYFTWAIAAIFVGASYYYFIACAQGIGRPLKQSSDIAAPQAASSSGLSWQPFSIDALDKQLSAHKTVFLDFTADWCLNCKANEKAVLDSAQVVAKLKALNVITMKADWTKQNPTITKLLKKFGRSGVPLYVIFPADKADDPIVLPEIVTPSIVLNGLDKAGPSK